MHGPLTDIAGAAGAAVSFDDGGSVVTTPPDTFRVTGTGVAERGRSTANELRAVPVVFRREVEFSGFVPGDVGEVVGCDGVVVARLFGRSGSLVWDGRDRSGIEVPAGAYFVRSLFGAGRRLRVVKLR